MAKRTTKRVLIVHHYAEFSPAELANFSDSVNGLVAANPAVPSPAVVLADMTTNAANLRATATLRLTDNSLALTQQENDEFTIVLDDLDALAGQIQTIGNKLGAGDTAVAKGFMEGFGFHTKKEADREGRFFKVVRTAHGSATIRDKASANKRALYVWQFSLAADSGWSDIIPTITSNVTFNGLQSDKRYYFRTATILPGGTNPVIEAGDHEPDWTDPISEVIP